MKRKYFFFDIDGTLTDDSTHKIVPSAEWTLHELERQGHFVSIATGRAHYKTVSFTDRIGIQNIVCCGGACLVLDGKVIHNDPLPRKKVLEIIDHAERDGLGYLLMLDDSDSVYMKDFRFLIQSGLRKELTSYIYDPFLEIKQLDHIYKIYLSLSSEREPVDWLKGFEYLRMTDNYILFQHDNKKQGVLDMMKYLNADPADVVVFGDGMNDLALFDRRWTSIAMGNAKSLLKEQADYVTDTNVNDGIMKACIRFGWIPDNTAK